ncbi:MAG TPA: hypothetical protein GX690_00800 [Tenericutes bacterium]|jgi:hypothetical protein|nr:hypothetical protein [Mycoplasmatota bacterium]
MSKRKLYIDFDGVIKDTWVIMRKMIIDANLVPDYSKETMDFLASINYEEDVLEKSAQINDSINNIKKIIAAGVFDVYILSHISQQKEAVAKIKYLRKQLDNITIIPVPVVIPKTMVVDPKGAILIDDTDMNLKAWEEAGGIAIKFQPEGKCEKNKTINYLADILNYDKLISKNNELELKKEFN